MPSRPILILTLVATVAASAALAGPVASPASASNRTIVAVVAHWLPIINKDETRIIKASKAHKLKSAARAYKHEARDLGHWRRQLKAQHPSSGKGATARHDLLVGVRKVAKAYGRIAKGLQGSLTPAGFKRDARLAGAGRKQANKGIHLLRTL